MKIGIDISQLAYKDTGVANYLSELVDYLVKSNASNEYILFFSSLRKNLNYTNKKVTIKKFKIPPMVLEFLWNRLHIMPIEWFIGDIDVFITSDWTEPPTTKAKKATIIYDLIVYKYPDETDKKIVDVQKRKLAWVKKESSMIFCISESTKKDVEGILKIDSKKVGVLYPGV